MKWEETAFYCREKIGLFVVIALVVTWFGSVCNEGCQMMYYV